MSDRLPVGQKIKLLPLQESDRHWYIALAMDETMMQYVGDPRTLEQATEDFETRATEWSTDNENWYALAIVDINNDDRLGDVAFKMLDAPAQKAEFGFMVKPKAQGKGVGSEALKLAIDYAFNSLGLNKLVAYCDVENLSSQKALEKNGFIREGCLRQNAFMQGRYVDDYVYGLCRCDL